MRSLRLSRGRCRQGSRTIWAARGLVDLPDDEGVDLEIVRDKQWLAFCEYLGGLRSRIAVNVDLPVSAVELLRLTMHEAYPGHHAERASKDHLPVRGRGLLEETLVLMPTPQWLVSEGIAELAPDMLLDGDGRAALDAVIRDAGIELDLAHALPVERAVEPCRWAEFSASLMLYNAGASEAEAHAYLERWGLTTPKLATHLIRFLNEPTSRTYAITYSAGENSAAPTWPGSRSASAASSPSRFASATWPRHRLRGRRSRPGHRRKADNRHPDHPLGRASGRPAHHRQCGARGDPRLHEALPAGASYRRAAAEGGPARSG
jgi:hypothetical protein